MATTKQPQLQKKRLNLGDYEDDEDDEKEMNDDRKGSNGRSGSGLGGAPPFKLAKIGGGAGAGAGGRGIGGGKRINPFKTASTKMKPSFPPPPSTAVSTSISSQPPSVSPSSPTHKTDSISPAPQIPAPENPLKEHQPLEEDEEELDYLSIPLPSEDTPTPTARLTLTQRQQLKLRRVEAASRIPSKKELAEQADRAREEGLKKSLLEEEGRRGLRLMKAMGWSGGVLGKRRDGMGGDSGVGEGNRKAEDEEDIRRKSSPPRQTPLLEPLAINIKQDRGGIGHLSEEQKKFREKVVASANTATADGSGQENADTYRTRISTSLAEKRAEGQFYAAQNILEAFDRGEMDPNQPGDHRDDTENTDKTALPRTATSLKDIPLLYRSLVKHREDVARQKLERFDILESLSSHHTVNSFQPPNTITTTTSNRTKPRLPVYARSLEEEDSDNDGLDNPLSGDLFAYDAPEQSLAEDLDDTFVEDEELEEFNKLSFVERRDMVVKELREKWLYCFWCKYRYKDKQEMEEGCPGLEEDLHG